jgi:asparagine synthase (glutamine-hydrolysing)
MLPDAGPMRRMRNFLNYATGGLGSHARAHDGLPFCQSHSLLGERLSGLELPQRQMRDSLESARRLLNDVFEFHRRTHFTAEFMPKVDGGTMYFGIEARAPLLDQKIWEFAASLPAEVRFHGGQLKAVLREIARRRIGPETAFRKKQGFTVPVERWLSDRWSGLLDRLKDGTILERDGWVRPGALCEPIRDAIAKRWVPVQLWRLLVLEHWMNAQGGAATVAPAAGVPDGLAAARRLPA